jgi:hypothetical protein
MASAYDSGPTGQQPLQGEKAFKEDQPPPYSHIREVENSRFSCEESCSSAQPRTRPQEVFHQRTPGHSDYRPVSVPLLLAEAVFSR